MAQYYNDIKNMKARITLQKQLGLKHNAFSRSSHHFNTQADDPTKGLRDNNSKDSRRTGPQNSTGHHRSVKVITLKNSTRDR